MDSQAEDGDQVEASEHEGELQSRGPLQLVGGKPLPLNSRRLTAPVLKQLAGALDLPSTAPLDDVRQMIEGKLLEMGRCHSGFGPAADRVRVGHDLLAETVRYREERPGSALELIA